MACTLTSIALTGDCRGGSAGIARLFVIPLELVASVDFDANQNLTGVTRVDPVNDKWIEIEFENENTSFFNQVKSVSKSNVNYAFEINVTIPLNNNTVRTSIVELDKCCNMLAVVLDNEDQLRSVGIRWLSGTTAASYKKLNLKTGPGSWNTGADPSSDSNEIIFSLTAQDSQPSHYVDNAVLTDILANLA